MSRQRCYFGWPLSFGARDGGNLNAPDMLELLESLIGEHRGVHSVVLGCTHYPFVRQQIRFVLGDVTFFDGGDGAARQLVRLLEEESLLADSQDFGDLRFCAMIAELAMYWEKRPCSQAVA